jgi:integrase
MTPAAGRSPSPTTCTPSGCRRGTWRPPTLAGYQSYLAKHFLPYFGRQQIGKIQPVHIQQWVTTAAAGGLSPASIRNPKDNEPRTLALRPALVQALRDHIHTHQLGEQDLLFATRDGTPISRNTFRTRIWTPAITASGIGYNVRIHDLRHAHASWLLAGGADLKSVMERMGHTQIQTTQKYLHALPDADQRNLDAFTRIADGPS